MGTARPTWVSFRSEQVSTASAIGQAARIRFPRGFLGASLSVELQEACRSVPTDSFFLPAGGIGNAETSRLSIGRLRAQKKAASSAAMAEKTTAFGISKLRSIATNGVAARQAEVGRALH